VGPGQTKPSNHYRVVIGQQIQKNGLPFELDWEDPKITSHMMIYNAMMFFYGSPLALYLGADHPQPCNEDGTCLFYPPEDAPDNDNLCIFGVRPLQLYLETECATDLQPAVSTVAKVYRKGEANDYRISERWADGGPVLNDAGGYVYICDAAVH
jgi:hypothetical protein